MLTENYVGSLYDVMEEMIRAVNVLLSFAFSACQVMRGWDEIGRCRAWKLGLFLCRQMARSWKLIGKMGFVDLLSYIKGFLGIRGL